jgi:ATP-dependent exoDNAse (exonuclease V) alpha subunit
MLQRNLLYTAVTRGKRLVVIAGQKEAMATAVRGRQIRRKWSKLRGLTTHRGRMLCVRGPSWRCSP